MLLTCPYNSPLWSVDYAAVPREIARFLGECDCARVDERFVALGIDAADFCENADGLGGCWDEACADLLEVVAGEVS
jgi:hypothetical protein